MTRTQTLFSAAAALTAAVYNSARRVDKINEERSSRG
jgi:hypothetical protein